MCVCGGGGGWVRINVCVGGCESAVIHMQYIHLHKYLDGSCKTCFPSAVHLVY